MKRHIVVTRGNFGGSSNNGGISLSPEPTRSPMNKDDAGKLNTVRSFFPAVVSKGTIIVATVLLAFIVLRNVSKNKNFDSLDQHFAAIVLSSKGVDGGAGARVSTTATSTDSSSAQRRRLFGDVLKDAFPFARNPTEFRLQVTFATKDADGVADDNADGDDDHAYSKADLALILRSLYTMLGFMNMPLWSGSPAYQHFIGVGSCLARLKRPANEVALGLLHGMYVQSWHPDLKTKETDECQRRNLLRSVIGSDLEEQLHYKSAVFGNGPQHSCIHVYKDVLLESRSNKNNQTIQNVVEGIPYHFLLCDEIEEFIGGDVPLANNWKRRDEHHFDLLQDLARLINEPKLVSWIETARQMTIALYDTTSTEPLNAYQQVSPRNYSLVYNRSIETFRNDADPLEVDRMKFVQDTSIREWPMLSPYFRPGESESMFKAVTATRNSCDRYESMRSIQSSSSTTTDNIKSDDSATANLDDYIYLLVKLRTQTLKRCETKNLLSPPELVPRTTKSAVILRRLTDENGPLASVVPPELVTRSTTTDNIVIISHATANHDRIFIPFPFVPPESVTRSTFK